MLIREHIVICELTIKKSLLALKPSVYNTDPCVIMCNKFKCALVTLNKVKVPVTHGDGDVFS